MSSVAKIIPLRRNNFVLARYHKDGNQDETGPGKKWVKAARGSHCAGKAVEGHTEVSISLWGPLRQHPIILSLGRCFIAFREEYKHSGLERETQHLIPCAKRTQVCTGSHTPLEFTRPRVDKCFSPLCGVLYTLHKVVFCCCWCYWKKAIF